MPLLKRPCVKLACWSHNLRGCRIVRAIRVRYILALRIRSYGIPTSTLMVVGALAASLVLAFVFVSTFMFIVVGSAISIPIHGCVLVVHMIRALMPCIHVYITITECVCRAAACVLRD